MRLFFRAVQCLYFSSRTGCKCGLEVRAHGLKTHIQNCKNYGNGMELMLGQNAVFDLLGRQMYCTHLSTAVTICD